MSNSRPRRNLISPPSPHEPALVRRSAPQPLAAEPGVMPVKRSVGGHQVAHMPGTLQGAGLPLATRALGWG